MRPLAGEVRGQGSSQAARGFPRDNGAVRFDDLIVRFAQFTLGPISLALDPGEVFSLVGPNGSGKTTLIKSLLGLLPLSAGRVSINGRPTAGRPQEVLRQIGYVADDTEETIPELTAWELWELHAMVHAQVEGTIADMLDRAEWLADALDFDPPGSPIGSYSHGMKKKVQLVAGFVHDPAIIVLDEPRNGLDPIAMARLDQLVLGARDRGKLVILATHDLHFAERMSDGICILQQGTVAAVDHPSRLRRPGEDMVQAFLRIVDEKP